MNTSKKWRKPLFRQPKGGLGRLFNWAEENAGRAFGRRPSPTALETVAVLPKGARLLKKIARIRLACAYSRQGKLGLARADGELAGLGMVI